MKKLILNIPLLSFAILSGCMTSNQQRTAANTLFAVHETTQSTVDGYFLAVYKGMASTNGIAPVSSAYNKFQLSYLVALDAVQYNTNALASDSLVTESKDVVNLVGVFYKGGK
jgi:hypothetical protein